MKILLLNPPAPVLVNREYYCSKTVKSTYLFSPIDLLLQSGILSENNEVVVLDAIALRWGLKKTFEFIKSLNPEVILGLVSMVLLSWDLEFYQALRQVLPSLRIFLSGEPILEDPKGWLEKYPFIDGLVLRFASSGLRDYLEEKREPEALAVKENSKIKIFPPQNISEYSVGRSRQELFQYKSYFFSFARKRRFATMLTDFGCPHKCRFCVMASLGYRRRNLEEVEEELDFLKWLGIDELFLADQSFGSHQAHSQKVMELLARYGFSYTTFVRPDHPEQFWKELKDSGCHTVIMGVESANEEILTRYQKGYGLEEIKRGVKQAQEQGLRVVATVIIGLPEDTRESILKTMRFLRELEPDFASYNLAVARNLTEFKAEAFRQGLVLSPEMDQAGNLSRIRTRALGSEELLKLKKRAIRDFYLRPGYIFKKLVEARSWFEVYALFREGIAVLLKNL